MDNSSDWQLKNGKLSERGKYLLQSGLWSDCKFVVGTKPQTRTFSAHKMFLSMASPVFEAMFYGGLAEKDTIEVPDVQTEAFETLLKYIYTDEIHLASIEQACELCYTAKKYMLPFVITECINFIWMDVDHLSACRAYEFAALFDESELKNKCLQIISQNAHLILKDKSFLEIQHSTLRKIVELDNLNISSELDLLISILNWATEECKRKGTDFTNKECLRSVVSDVLSKIRFLTLTPSEFASCSAISLLLTQDETYRILMRISSPDTFVPYPDDFCDKTVPRSRSKLFTDVFCCKRTIVQLKRFQNTGGRMENYCTFMVNRNILMLGIQVSSQVSFAVSSFEQTNQQRDCNTSTSCSKNMYKENMSVYIHDPSGKQMAYGYFNVDVKYGTIIEINLNNPVILHKDIEYKLTIVLNQKGTYTMGTYSKHTNSCVGVLFTFSQGTVIGSLGDCIVQGILFTLPLHIETDEVCHIPNGIQPLETYIVYPTTM